MPKADTKAKGSNINNRAKSNSRVELNNRVKTDNRVNTNNKVNNRDSSLCQSTQLKTQLANLDSYQSTNCV